MLLFFILIVAGIQNRMVGVQDDRNQELAGQLARVLNNEAVLAETVHDGYRREFYLPVLLDGSDYSLELYERQDLVIRYRGSEHVFFLDANLTNATPLRPGRNVVINP
ncbi:hypothetical protein KY327_01065 [Candidatus Woesearchaeota archaeon]|nr:hypothetical protein [Candidatus Woesearchaeota archaeon]